MVRQGEEQEEPERRVRHGVQCGGSSHSTVVQDVEVWSDVGQTSSVEVGEKTGGSVRL